jgi:hypothetical protein
MVLAIKRRVGETLVIAAPITHATAGRKQCCRDPAATKQRLGMDEQRS